MQTIQRVGNILMSQEIIIGIVINGRFWIKTPWNGSPQSALLVKILKEILKDDGFVLDEKEYRNIRVLILPASGSYDWFDQYLREIISRAENQVNPFWERVYRKRILLVEESKKAYADIGVVSNDAIIQAILGGR